LDAFVWNEITRLLDDATLIEGEIDRRREEARNADPVPSKNSEQV